MLSAIEFLRDKLKKEFNFSASDNVFELAKKLEIENLQKAYQRGIDECQEAYREVINSASEQLKTIEEKTNENN
jgi:hypothetical protein